MKAGKWRSILMAVGIVLLVCSGCQKKDVPKAAKTVNVADATIQGMYLTFGEEGEEYIFADVKNNYLFYAKIPEDNLLDETGEKISEDDLKKGDIVAVYNSGIVAESFPPQYPGVTKMVRVEKGTAEDAKKYDELIAQIYQAPDPSQVPYMDVENKRETAIVTSAVNHGGYEWSYTDENGEEQHVIADATHVLEWERSNTELVELICDAADKDLKLRFSRKPMSVTVTRWDGTATTADIEKGEAVEVELDGKEAELDDAIPGSVYEVVAEWKNGTVTYGFAVK